jgi:hypothetical protein
MSSFGTSRTWRWSGAIEAGGPAEKYTAMLRVAYPLIKAANPEVQVLAGALAPTLAPPGSEAGMDDLIFLQAHV